jgi:hydroxymethylbilane synthase
MPFNARDESAVAAIGSRIILGTRQSPLALWQTNRIIASLTAAYPALTCDIKSIVTTGDASDAAIPSLDAVGVFTRELEVALREGVVHAAVHSLKDLPTMPRPGLALGAICLRDDPRDALVSRGVAFVDLPTGARIGTSSPRRMAQILALRSDLCPEPIRGNVETRLQKVRTGEYHAAVLAAAGLHRLGLESEISEYFSVERMMPAPGQGALAVQCRSDDPSTLELLATIDESAMRAAVEAERAFLSVLEGGCTAPIGAYANITGNTLHVAGLVVSPDGKRSVFVEIQGTPDDPTSLGREAARQAIQRGAQGLMA